MAGFSKMVDMAKTPEEVKEDVAEVAPVTQAKVPVYPYGLCLALTEDEMEKLDLDPEDLPEVGDMIHIAGMAKVTSVSSRENEDTEGNKTKCCRVELQITHLAVESEDAENAEEETQARRQRFYGDDESEAA